MGALQPVLDALSRLQTENDRRGTEKLLAVHGSALGGLPAARETTQSTKLDMVELRVSKESALYEFRSIALPNLIEALRADEHMGRHSPELSQVCKTIEEDLSIHTPNQTLLTYGAILELYVTKPS